MAQSAELESMVTGLTVAAFEAFTQEISEMFDIAVSVKQVSTTAGTVNDLKKTYKKLAAVCSIEAQGGINGQFYVIFGSNGLFTLAGTFALQPEEIIKQKCKSGTEAEANEAADAISEVGNLVIETWDKGFRKEMPEHGQFVQIGTFIGQPWNKPEENIGLAADAELVILTFEMKVEPLPAFKCAVVYPKSLFGPVVDQIVAQAEPADQADAAKEPAAEEAAAESSAEEPETQDAKDTAVGEQTEASAQENETPEEDTQKPATDQPVAEEPANEPAQSQSEQKAADKEPQAEEAPAGPVSDSVQKMVKSPAVLPGQFPDVARLLNTITAADVMTTNVVWATPDETVEQLTAKMQQHDTAYLLIGNKGELQGIVSKSDIRGALSPYLQSMFAKWRTPLDIATLQIKAQWIMSRPVRTVRGDATLVQAVGFMSEHRIRCVPVTDQEGKVAGIVTVFDIFHVFSNCTAEISQV